MCCCCKRTKCHSRHPSFRRCPLLTKHAAPLTPFGWHTPLMLRPRPRSDSSDGAGTSPVGTRGGGRGTPSPRPPNSSSAENSPLASKSSIHPSSSIYLPNQGSGDEQMHAPPLQRSGAKRLRAHRGSSSLSTASFISPGLSAQRAAQRAQRNPRKRSGSSKSRREGSSKKRSRTSGRDPRALRFLVVEDNKVNQKLVKRMLMQCLPNVKVSVVCFVLVRFALCCTVVNCLMFFLVNAVDSRSRSPH